MQGPDNKDRRRSSRLNMEKQLIAISWIDAEGNARTRDVICIDVSSGGLQIELDHSIPPNTLVIVVFTPNQTKFQSYETRVLRVQQQAHGWFNIGLQFIKD